MLTEAIKCAESSAFTTADYAAMLYCFNLQGGAGMHQWCSWSLGRFWVQWQEPAQQNPTATIWIQSHCLSITKAARCTSLLLQTVVHGALTLSAKNQCRCDITYRENTHTFSVGWRFVFLHHWMQLRQSDAGLHCTTSFWLCASSKKKKKSGQSQ